VLTVRVEFLESSTAITMTLILAFQGGVNRNALKNLILAVAVLVPATTFADPRPLWEFGLGAVGLHLPDYRGSAESRNYLYPLPYFVYRGDWLRIDREGARAKFFEMGRARMDFSLNATPPVHSEENSARQSMPDLDPTVEIGPVLNVSLIDGAQRDRRLELRLPLRAVIATNFLHARSAGFVFYPHVNSDIRLGGWDLGLQGGTLFGTAKYHRYFYGVDPIFATPERPTYVARGGYSGFVGLASLSRRFGKLWVGGFVRYDALRGATFESSPLVKRDYSFMAGLACAWVLAESETRVEVTE